MRQRFGSGLSSTALFSPVFFFSVLFGTIISNCHLRDSHSPWHQLWQGWCHTPASIAALCLLRKCSRERERETERQREREGFMTFPFHHGISLNLLEIQTCWFLCVVQLFSHEIKQCLLHAFVYARVCVCRAGKRIEVSWREEDRPYATVQHWQ